MNELTTAKMNELIGGAPCENLPSLAPSASLVEIPAVLARKQQQARLCAIGRCHD